MNRKRDLTKSWGRNSTFLGMGALRLDWKGAFRWLILLQDIFQFASHQSIEGGASDEGFRVLLIKGKHPSSEFIRANVGADA